MIIQDLDKQKLPDAIALVNRVFPQQPFFEQARLGLPISISSGFLSRTLAAIAGVESVRYWVATLGLSKVVGITGLYLLRSDLDSSWLGWTCVAPEFRGKGFGKGLLSKAILHAKYFAKHEGRRYLKLYTSPENVVALQMYQQHGFVQYSEQGKRIYLQLDFKE